ncbi:MAG: hypothetical protein QXV22_04905, partial [Thermoplasmataceae archaeon]
AGDVVNLFASYPNVTPRNVSVGSYANLIISVKGIGPLLIWHEIEALIILILAAIILPLALKRHIRSVSLCAALGLFFVLSAIVGGLLFVLSGFTANGSSAQMGGSFIGAYAMYFLLLYFSRNENSPSIKTGSLTSDGN